MKMNKFKLFGLAALLSANLSAKAANTDQTTPVNDSTHTKAVKIMESITIQQMEDFINEANVALTRLRRKIRDPLTPKQERFDAYKTYEQLEYERDDMVKMLDAKRTGKTLVLYDIPNNLTIPEMQQYIDNANKEIKKLEKKVDCSPELSPEERKIFYDQYKTWKRNRDEMQKRLEAAQRSSVISYNSGYGSR